MFEIKRINTEKELETLVGRGLFVDSMFEFLEQYGDPKDQINTCIDYAFSDSPGMGGFILAGLEDGKFIGGVIMNRTGMSGYIPDNILVYVAVNSACRGKGYGKKLCIEAVEQSDGDVKLHVEFDNPAKGLYEHIGFTNKYAEMRFIK